MSLNVSACGKERAGYDRFSHHIPKNRGPNVPDEQRLLDHIMKGYERSVRPVRNWTSPVVIKMGLTLTQVLDMVRKLTILYLYLSFLCVNITEPRVSPMFIY